jgi:hypothetical protein
MQAVALAFLLPGAALATEPRILLVDNDEITDCTAPLSCDDFTTTFVAGQPQGIAVIVNGIGELSKATFGISKPNTSVTVSMCNGGSVESAGSDVFIYSIIWTSDEPCVSADGAFIRLMNLRATTTWPGEFAVVENAIFQEITVTDCSGKTYEVLPENRGVAGFSMPSYVPCSDATPVDTSSWAAVKALFGR